MTAVTTPPTAMVPPGGTQAVFTMTTATVTSYKYVIVTAQVPAGSKTVLWDFDHARGEFVPTATATVSDDGLTVTTDPGAYLRTSATRSRPRSRTWSPATATRGSARSR